MLNKIFIASDHAGVDIKNKIINFLQSKDYDIQDVAMQEDYTDIAHKVALLTANDDKSFGILICGSGIGVSIVANRTKNIRAAVCHSTEVAKLSRNHNNANVLCLGSRIVNENLNLEITNIFLQSSFDGGRHQARINKIDI